ncbi:YolD-like family protein [Bacillus sp. CGMCC 1.16607]|uniref:YolD-like family protein n=1 Tax=Bacillus sp. CGMCC 1.16607 TaxID=3351842 RepID=UPI003631AA5B
MTIRESELNKVVSSSYLSEHQIVDIENIILEARGFANIVKIKTWEDGYFWEYEGLIVRFEEVGNVIYLEKNDGYIMKVKFSDIVGITNFDD